MATWIGRLKSGELGWKTAVGSACIMIGVVGHALPLLTRDQSDYLVLIGAALGFIGLRDAVAKLAKQLGTSKPS